MSRFIGYSAIASALCASFVCFPSTSAAQKAVPLAQKKEAVVTPRLSDGHPDFSGFFTGGADPDAGVKFDNVGASQILNRLPDGSILYEHIGPEDSGVGKTSVGAGTTYGVNPPPYKPEYLEKAKAIAATGYGTISRLDPVMNCRPAGVPRAFVGIASPAMQIVHNPKFLAILYENAPGPVYRIIYTDGRTHPADWDSSYMGHSIGHWEGDVLVVDVTGLNDETWLSNGVKGEGNANIHSDKEHVIERWSRVGNELTYQATVEDPVMFTKPWVLASRTIRIAPPNEYLIDLACNTNDRDHIISESEKDKFLCNWCNPNTLYGDKAGGVSTGQAIPDNLKDALETKEGPKK